MGFLLLGGPSSAALYWVHRGEQVKERVLGEGSSWSLGQGTSPLNGRTQEVAEEVGTHWVLGGTVKI